MLLGVAPPAFCTGDIPNCARTALSVSSCLRTTVLSKFVAAAMGDAVGILHKTIRCPPMTTSFWAGGGAGAWAVFTAIEPSTT